MDLETLVAILIPLESILEPLRKRLGASWGRVKPSSGCLGQSWRDLGTSLGASWSIRDRLGGVFGPSWDVLGRSWCVLGGIADPKMLKKCWFYHDILRITFWIKIAQQEQFGTELGPPEAPKKAQTGSQKVTKSEPKTIKRFTKKKRIDVWGTPGRKRGG